LGKRGRSGAGERDRYAHELLYSSQTVINSIPDSLVDSVTIAPASPDSATSYVEVDAEGELSPIQSLLESVSPDDLDLCAKGTRNQIGFGNDMADCDFGHFNKPDGEPFNGVRIGYWFRGSFSGIEISREAFDRLMSRYFAVIIPLVEQRYPKIAAESWWAEFLEDVAFIRARAQDTL